MGSQLTRVGYKNGRSRRKMVDEEHLLSSSRATLGDDTRTKMAAAPISVAVANSNSTHGVNPIRSSMSAVVIGVSPVGPNMTATTRPGTMTAAAVTSIA